MRIVAVCALHEAFVHAVLGWQFELTAHAGMASVTELALPLGQQILLGGRMMDGMAACTSHIVQRVIGPPDIGLGEVSRMAGEACVHGSLWGQKGKSLWDGGTSAALRHMPGRASMASFTTGSFRRFLAGSDAFEMWVLEEIEPYIRVAGAAHLAANKTGGRLRGLSERVRNAKKTHYQPRHNPHHTEHQRLLCSQSVKMS